MNKSYLVICIVCLICAYSAIGATLNVPSAQYPTIQSAIDAATDGDIVEVAVGTYYEGLVWRDKAIALIGAGADVTIVDATGLSQKCLRMINVPDTAGVEGFTFTGGRGTYGGGVDLSNSFPTLAHNIITGNSAWSGGGLNLGSSSPTLTNNIITGNSAEYFGGGLCLWDSSPTLTNNTITRNSAGRGGGAIPRQILPDADQQHHHGELGLLGRRWPLPLRVLVPNVDGEHYQRQLGRRTGPLAFGRDADEQQHHAQLHWI